MHVPQHKNSHNSKASKKNTTIVKPFAGSSGVARGNKAKPSRYHLCDGVVEGSVEGFFLIM
jgi:hypothetical protein